MKNWKEHAHSRSFESILQTRFYEFEKHHNNRFINLLYNERLRRILRMLESEVDLNWKTCTVLDLGCSRGFFSKVISMKFRTIGIDSIKRFEFHGVSNLDFVLADISSMPFKSQSIDIVVCASVLEHLLDLRGSILKIKHVLKKNGILIAGYPVETSLFKFVWRYVSPWSFRYIDQRQTYWVDPLTRKRECYWESSETHKQTYQEIRKVLNENFQVLEEEKLPFDKLPDSITYYECIKMRN